MRVGKHPRNRLLKGCVPLRGKTNDAGPGVSKLECSCFGLTECGPAFDWECYLRVLLAVSSWSPFALRRFHVDGDWLLEAEGKRSFRPEVDVPLAGEVGDCCSGSGANGTADECSFASACDRAD